MEKTLQTIQSDALRILRELDRFECVKYLTEELKKIGFVEYNEGCFKYGDNFKVVFSADWGDRPAMLPMQVIYKEPSGCGTYGPERKNALYLNLYTVGQVRFAYTALMGESL